MGEGTKQIVVHVTHGGKCVIFHDDVLLDPLPAVSSIAAYPSSMIEERSATNSTKVCFSDSHTLLLLENNVARDRLMQSQLSSRNLVYLVRT